MKYYCLGIKGTGMSTLAQILKDLGNEVSGYDDAKDYKFTEKGLEERNIKIYYDNEHDIDKNTIVTYSVALDQNHKELVRARELGLQIKKYNEIVGDITKMFNTICVSGTHGKTTTSSIVKHIISNTLGCNYFIGAGDGYATKDNEIFVIESDEFNRHFLTYHPTNTIITNIEEEHMECYNDLDDIINTFKNFAKNTKDTVIMCGDNENVRKLELDNNKVYYGFDENNDYIIKNSKTLEDGEEFDLYNNDTKIDTYKIKLFGKHIVLDCTAAIIMCLKYGISNEKIKELLLTFKNAKRRFAEEKINDTIIIDDYAHHPTEINATIDAIKRKYKDKRLVVVFRPNTYSRTKDFKDAFVNVLKKADKVYLTDILSNREKQSDYPGVTSRMITDEIDGAEIINDGELDRLKDERNSVVAFMSCASIEHLIDEFKEVMSK